jgi:hypothetical protein
MAAAPAGIGMRYPKQGVCQAQGHRKWLISKACRETLSWFAPESDRNGGHSTQLVQRIDSGLTGSVTRQPVIPRTPGSMLILHAVPLPQRRKCTCVVDTTIDVTG